jgi:hypothetical protein
MAATYVVPALLRNAHGLRRRSEACDLLAVQQQWQLEGSCSLNIESDTASVVAVCSTGTRSHHERLTQQSPDRCWW